MPGGGAVYQGDGVRIGMSGVLLRTWGASQTDRRPAEKKKGRA